jgi:hypothetical protein
MWGTQSWYKIKRLEIWEQGQRRTEGGARTRQNIFQGLKPHA